MFAPVGRGTSTQVLLDLTPETPLHSLLHFIPLKLNSTNYLAWSQQVSLVLTLHNLIGHVDGTSSKPPETVLEANRPVPNPTSIEWLTKDQSVYLLLKSSLSEEAMSEIIGISNARQIWLALETAYSHRSTDRMHILRDNLRMLQKGSSSVAEFGRKFKTICDQLAAIGHPVDETDKCHWFLCGLGTTFEHFSATHRALGTSSFRGFLGKAENQETFMTSLHGQNTPQAAFIAQQSRSGNTSRSSSGSSYTNRGRGRGRNAGRGRGKRPPHCQLCRKDGHYANTCPDLASFAKQAAPLDANLAQAFHAQCHVTDDYLDWTGDTGSKDQGNPSKRDV